MNPLFVAELAPLHAGALGGEGHVPGGNPAPFSQGGSGEAGAAAPGALPGSTPGVGRGGGSGSQRTAPPPLSEGGPAHNNKPNPPQHVPKDKIPKGDARITLYEPSSVAPAGFQWAKVVGLGAQSDVKFFNRVDIISHDPLDNGRAVQARP